MITLKYWTKYNRTQKWMETWRGWFLFGFIPIIARVISYVK